MQRKKRSRKCAASEMLGCSEEAPERAASEESDWPFHALCISGASKAALEANTAAVAAHLRANPDEPLADVAFTLKEGRPNQIKRMLDQVGHRVLRLRRTAIGPLRLRGIRPGEVRPLRPEELARLRKALEGRKRGSGSGPLDATP